MAIRKATSLLDQVIHLARLHSLDGRPPLRKIEFLDHFTLDNNDIIQGCSTITLYHRYLQVHVQHRPAADEIPAKAG